MSDNDNYFKILEKLTEMNGSMGELKATVKNVERDIEEIRVEDRRQNELLAEHIAGVQKNSARLDVEVDARREQHEHTLMLIETHKKDNDKQFQEHEEKSEVRMTDIGKQLEEATFLPRLGIMIRKSIIWIGAPAGAIYTIGKLSGWF